jgi:Icc-related predicted phosphoesterase
METRFVSTGDFGGNVGIVRQLLGIDFKQYSFAVFTGDLIAMKELRKIGEATARGFHIEAKIDYAELSERLARVNQVFQQVAKQTRFYGILGNSDLKKTFVSLVPRIQMESIHNKVVSINGYFLIGYGGRPMNVDEIEKPNEVEKAGIFPGRTYRKRAMECNAWKEEEAYEDLSRILHRIDPGKCILVTHYPPYGVLDQVEQANIQWAIASYGAKARNGNIGSDTFRRITEEFGILLHIFSHVHESKGVKTIGSTTYVNIGSLEEDKDICEVRLKNQEVSVDFLKLPSPKS